MPSKELKELASIVALITGILVGVDKSKDILKKWRKEFREDNPPTEDKKPQPDSNKGNVKEFKKKSK